MISVNDKIGLAEAAALERRKKLLERKKRLENKSNGIEDEEQSIPKVENEEEKSPSLSIDQNDQPNNEIENDLMENQEANEEPTRPSIIDEELDLNELAPRKIDWDLKRDNEPKLQILQERTELAIAELVRDGLVDDIELC